MCIHMCLHQTCLCVRVCVCVCVQPRADAEMKTKYKNTLTISTLLLCLFRPGRGVTCVPWRKVSSHVEPLFILWSLREISQLLRVLRDTGLCCSDCEAGTHPWNFLSLDNDSAWGVSRCKTHYLPGAVYAMWVHCSPGTLEDALCLRGVSIRVPPTTLSAIGLALSQQPVRGSQPRDPPIRLISPGPLHPVPRCLPPLSSASGHQTHTSSRFPTIPLTPSPQRASGSHRIPEA